LVFVLSDTITQDIVWSINQNNNNDAAAEAHAVESYNKGLMDETWIIFSFLFFAL
jgi:hypothetical protein